MQIPKYRGRKDRDIAFVQYRNKRYYFPGKFNSAESKSAYHEFISKLVIAKSERPPVVPRTAIRIAELCDLYMHYAQGYYLRDGRPGSEYGLICNLCKPLVRLYGYARADELVPSMYKAFRAALIDGSWIDEEDKTNGCKPWGRKNINKQMGRLKRMFKWGVENDLVLPETLWRLREVSPLRKNKTFAKEYQPVGPVDQSDVDRTLPFCNPVVRDMVMLQRLTGMRSQSVCQFMWCDVDRRHDIWLYTPSRHKMQHLEKPLVIALGPKAQAILRKYLGRSRTLPIFSPKEGSKHPTKRMGNAYNRKTYYRSVWYAIQRANEAAKLGEPPVKHWHPHQFRHSVGTLARETYGVEGSQAALGHASVDATQVYAEKSVALAMRIARNIG